MKDWRYIIREQRGDITVHSIPDQGTEVKVRLPLVKVPATVDRVAARASIRAPMDIACLRIAR